MQRRDFHFVLPAELIARYPPAVRGHSRLLFLNGDNGRLKQSSFNALTGYLQPGDLLVMNDTRVVPARLFARKPSGGKVEIMLDRQLDQQHIRVLLRASKSPKPGSDLIVDDGIKLRVVRRVGEMFILSIDAAISPDVLFERYGRVALPSYIDRPGIDRDSETYQTVYARHPGAVAAPTAGLHFSRSLLDRLNEKGIEHVFLTLHIGFGTFQPIRVEDIRQHNMHAERIVVTEQVVDKIKQTKDEGGRIVAVGTTVVRGLEAASLHGGLAAFRGETDIFIYPGFTFKIVDLLITNFHLPESSLLMLVCAFAGREPVLQAYHYAIEQRFHFYSYGDAMLVSRKGLGRPSPGVQ